MSKQAGEKNRNLFLAWVDEMKSQEATDWNPFLYNGKLSTTKIGRELGFSKKSFEKSRNLQLSIMLEELQDWLNESGVYHKRIPRLKEESAETVKEGAKEEITDSAKVRDLKRANRRLQAENAKLSAEVAKLSEFKEVLVEMKLWK